jgi:hypothetical protein
MSLSSLSLAAGLFLPLNKLVDTFVPDFFFVAPLISEGVTYALAPLAAGWNQLNGSVSVVTR